MVEANDRGALRVPGWLHCCPFCAPGSTTDGHLIMVYRSMNRDGDTEGVARKAVERAEQELTLHAESSRPGYLGANYLVALGERDRARSGFRERCLPIPIPVLTSIA